MSLIDRDATLKTLEGLTEQCRGEGATLVKAMVFAALKSHLVIPDVDVDRKRGFWLKLRDPDDAGNILCECSNCRRCDEFALNQNVSFCWNCGAEMVGVNDSIEWE